MPPGLATATRKQNPHPCLLQSNAANLDCARHNHQPHHLRGLGIQRPNPALAPTCPLSLASTPPKWSNPASKTPSRRIEQCMANDLLSSVPESYDAASIEVLEDMEHVRLRPGMYIGGKDDRALHHMVAEIIDNSMDEAVAGHATWIEVEHHANGHVSVRDNGRGIPVGMHPKLPNKSALEVIFCTLNAGGKFSGDSYQTSGGLHGVGSSVVNALSDHLRVEVARNKELYAMEFSRGVPQGPLAKIGAAPNRRGTSVTFHPDPQIFGSLQLKPHRLFKMARSKAYLFSGVEIRWKSGIPDGDTPMEATFRFPGGLADYLGESLNGSTTYADKPFAGKVSFTEKYNVPGSVEWAINWTPSRDGFIQSYTNTVPTPEGGTHEGGFWTAILKGIKAYG
ncbi:MAG: ATP-binding protein, partial [Pseudorhodobacter sp.]